MQHIQLEKVLIPIRPLIERSPRLFELDELPRGQHIQVVTNRASDRHIGKSLRYPEEFLGNPQADHESLRIATFWHPWGTFRNFLTSLGNIQGTLGQHSGILRAPLEPSGNSQGSGKILVSLGHLWPPLSIVIPVLGQYLGMPRALLGNLYESLGCYRVRFGQP